MTGRWQLAAFVLAHCLPPSSEPRGEFRAQEKQIAIRQIFLDDVRVAANRAALRGQRSPILTIIGRAINIGTHIAVPVRVQGDVSGAFVKMARVDGRDQRFLGSPECADDVRPSLPPVFGDLDMAVIRAGQMTLGFWRFPIWSKSWCASRGGVVDGDAPDSSCFCFSGSLVVRSGEIRSQVCPWSRDRNRNERRCRYAALSRAQVDRGIPVVSKLALFVLRQRLILRVSCVCG